MTEALSHARKERSMTPDNRSFIPKIELKQDRNAKGNPLSGPLDEITYDSHGSRIVSELKPFRCPE